MTITQPLTVPEAALARLVEAAAEESALTTREDIEESRDPVWVPGDDTYARSAA